ncbi:hypothetical protein HDU99_010557 [Rhizoclosmatium hyalinum]|nr:hypothetical protein HDU99_010557 [Rhizoclosmatium hyalinum]
MVQVFIDVDGLGTWKNCFTKNDVTLPERGYFGFTSHTGDAADNHDLIRIMTYQIENEHTGKQEPPSSQPTRVDRRPDINLKTNTPVPLSAQGTSSGASYVWYGVLVVFIILAVGGIGAAAFVAYSKMNSPKSYKRF